VKNFRFRKIIKRNTFTTIFGGIGQRRFVSTYIKRGRIEHIYERMCFNKIPRYKIEKTRRAHQGWRNKRIGTIETIKVRLRYGRHKPVPQFRR